MKLIVFTLFLLAFTTPSWAATYYVNKSGNDANSCTTAQSTIDSNAKLTLNAGASCLTAGSTLSIGDGTYVERLTNVIPSGVNQATPTTVMAENRGLVIIQPGTPLSSIVNVNARQWIMFDGLVVDGTGTNNRGISLGTNGANTQGITIQYNIIRNIVGNSSVIDSGTCIALQQNVGGHIVRHNKIDGCAVNDPQNSHGIYSSGPNNTIEYNEVTNSAGHGIHLFHVGTNNNTVRYNYVHDNGTRGILIGSGDNNIAYGNISSNNGSDGMSIGFAGTTNNKAYHNTMYNNGSSCIEVRGSSTGAMIKNNYCLETAGHSGTNAIDDAGVSTTGTCGNNGNICNTNTTHLIDTANHRFSPSETGVATLVNQGVVISGFSNVLYGYVGSAPDVGAFEAPTFMSASVEDGDASNIRIIFNQPAQNIRVESSGASVGFGACGGSLLTYYGVVFNSIPNTVNDCDVVEPTRIDIQVNTALLNSQSAELTYTRGATVSLRGNVCIGGATIASTGLACRQPEVLSFTAQTITNHVGAASTAVFTQDAYRCVDIWFSSISSPVFTKAENTTCLLYPGQYGAIAINIAATVADPPTTSLVIQYNDNGGSYALLTNNSAVNGIGFSVQPLANFPDGTAIPIAIITNSQSAYSPGEVLGQDRTIVYNCAPTCSTQVIVMFRLDPTAIVGHQYGLRFYHQTGVALDAYSQTALINVVSPQAIQVSGAHELKGKVALR